MIIRTEKKSHYTILPNEFLLDETISDKARGTLARLLSRPDNWNLNINYLVKTGKDGHTAIRSAIRELEAAGYIRKDVTRHENGRIIGVEYIICESKCSTGLDETCHTEMGGQVHEELTSAPETPCKTDDIQEEIIEVEVVEPATSTKNVQMSKTVMRESIKTETAPIINTDIKQILRETTTTTPDPVPEPTPEPVIYDHDTLLPVSSSSSSTHEIINLIPEQHRSPVVLSLVNKAMVDYPVREVEEAIAYAGANVRGGSFQFRAYLDKTLKNKWAEGYLDTMQEPNFNRGYGASWIHPMAKYPNGTVTGCPRMDTNYLVAADFLTRMGVDVDQMCAEA